MSDLATPTEEQLETAQRLRGSIARLARLLRGTDAGIAPELPPARISVLFAAERHGPIRLSEVAEREGLNPTLLSRLVGNLVADGLIERTADPIDRRSAWLEATAAGRELVAQIRRQRTEAIEAALSTLSLDERELLLGALPALEHLAEQLAVTR